MKNGSAPHLPAFILWSRTAAMVVFIWTFHRDCADSSESLFSMLTWGLSSFRKFHMLPYYSLYNSIHISWLHCLKIQTSGNQRACFPTNSMAPGKVHIPSFGDWNGNQDVVISEYFDIARASRVKKEGSVNGYAVSGPKGRVPIHQTGLNSSSIPEKRGAHRKVPTSIRPANSAPLASREKDLYHVKPGAKKDIYQRKSKSATDVVSVVPSAKVRKEFGGSRTPSPSYVKAGSEKSSANNKATKKKALPKFGDWDVNDPTGGTPFTTIFDEARNEKKGAIPADKTSTQRNASSPIDEDLYKQQSPSHKKYGEKILSIISKIFSGKMICQ